MKHVRVSQTLADVTVIRFVFFLQPSFSAFDLMAAIECLKDANREAGQLVYDWLLLSEDGESVRASNGISIPVDDGLTELNRQDRLMVFCGDEFATSASKPVLGWLRRMKRVGVTVGSVSNGAFTVLQAGAFSADPVSTHWSYRQPLQETHETVEVSRAIFLADEKQFSCAGGVSTLDLMLHLIAQDHDIGIATAVADSLVYSQPRTSAHMQTISQAARLAGRNGRVAHAIEIMTETLESPITPGQIADEIGISTRQLERLFLRYVECSPKAYYMRLRLERARGLLLQTDMKVIDVAMASGFNSASHFSKLYRGQYGVTPYRERGFASGPKT